MNEKEKIITDPYLLLEAIITTVMSGHEFEPDSHDEERALGLIRQAKSEWEKEHAIKIAKSLGYEEGTIGYTSIT